MIVVRVLVRGSLFADDNECDIDAHYNASAGEAKRNMYVCVFEGKRELLDHSRHGMSGSGKAVSSERAREN